MFDQKLKMKFKLAKNGKACQIRQGSYGKTFPNTTRLENSIPLPILASFAKTSKVISATALVNFLWLGFAKLNSLKTCKILWTAWLLEISTLKYSGFCFTVTGLNKVLLNIVSFFSESWLRSSQFRQVTISSFNGIRLWKQ